MDETVEHWCGEFKFTWDKQKARTNIENHKISFEVACWAVINDTRIAEEQEEEDGEQRTAIISYSRMRKILYV